MPTRTVRTRVMGSSSFWESTGLLPHATQTRLIRRYTANSLLHRPGLIIDYFHYRFLVYLDGQCL